ncbi:unnamed protein product [Rodentolepis nana]|uniref:G_PROTEIN_RECEP_F1_2 domain-containing protein n=1 Tax=Rodentolepis nana TaxID=102285 RepID=A0A0R3T127_RODNA|nr:unnamed protein product [Rodentolepis nana]
MACQFLEFAESWSSFVAAYIILAFGMDRILSISFPHRFQKDRYIKATLLLYLGIMLAGALLNAPITARFQLMYEERDTMNIWLGDSDKNLGKMR